VGYGETMALTWITTLVHQSATPHSTDHIPCGTFLTVVDHPTSYHQQKADAARHGQKRSTPNDTGSSVRCSGLQIRNPVRRQIRTERGPISGCTELTAEMKRVTPQLQRQIDDLVIDVVFAAAQMTGTHSRPVPPEALRRIREHGLSHSDAKRCEKGGRRNVRQNYA
jgi:hypothetical protein